MAAAVLKVRSAVFGAGPAGEELPPEVGIELPSLDERITVRDLIERTVREQVRELMVARRSKAQQRNDPETISAARRILDRQYLTRDDVRAQLEGGAVKMPYAKEGDATEAGVRTIDAGREVGRALKAFDERAFCVFADGAQLSSLDDELEHKPETEITFLRVMPLVGG